MYAYGFRGRELESIGVSPVCKFIETLLEMTFDNMDMLRSVADQKIDVSDAVNAVIFGVNRCTLVSLEDCM